ncbi:hypothetical protein, partial [Cereibacter sediminicola]|uniref:hypothetical protein n=1 Tax=Cereibacter sediminicola TaxID=2584941 RepID=UPI001FE7C1AD
MGSRLSLDRCSWLVTGKEKDGYAVENTEDGECITLSFARVDQAIRDGACDVIKPAEDEMLKAVRAYTGGYETFEQLPEEQQKAVRGRLPVVLAILAMEADGTKLTHRNMSPNKTTRSEGRVLRELKERARNIADGSPVLGAKRGGRVTVSLDWPQGRTLRKYVDTYLRFGRNCVVLLDRDHMKGPREAKDRQRMSCWQERFISYALNLWHDEKKPPLTALARMAETQFPIPPEEIARDRWYPSITTLRTRKNALSEVTQTLGRKGVRQGANLKGAGSTDIPALMFGERVATDQVYLSIHTDGKGLVRAKEIDPAKASEDLEDNEICRLWLHLMIDVATRLVLAWIIAESADADHSHALFRMATRDKTKEKVRYGCKRDPAPPAGLLLTTADNGTATRNGTVYASQLGIDSIVMTSRTYHSTDNAFVERPFGTLQWQVLNFLDGYAGSRPGELEGYEPEANARITHDELYGIITRYFVDEYPFAPHRGTGMFGATPWQKYDEVTKFYGGIDVPDRRERCLHLGVKRKMHTTSEGVNPFKIPFNSTALQVFAAGKSKEVMVHIDPDFMRHAYVTAKGHPEIIEVDLRCQSASKIDPQSASNFDPP